MATIGTGNEPAPSTHVRWRNWRWADLLALLFILAWAAVSLSELLDRTSQFLGAPWDGPFQSFNAVRRIDDGQVPGRDFFFFHGMATPYLLYPLYALFGKTIFASVLSDEVLSLSLFLAGYVAFFKAVSRRWGATLTLTAFAIAVSVLVPLTTLSSAGNSLQGVRSAIPVFFAAVLLRRRASPGSRLSQARGALLTGGLLSLAVLFGTEQGIALVVAYLITLIVLGRDVWTRMLRPAVVLLATGGWLLMISWAITRGSLSDVFASLSYNLVEVPRDQFWLFGVPPNNFVGNIGELLTDYRFLVVLLVAVGLFVRIWLLSSRGRLHSPEKESFGTLSMYGAISSLSYLGIEQGPNLASGIRASLLTALGMLYVVLIRNHPDMPAAIGSPFLRRGWAMRRGMSVAVMVLAFVSISGWTSVPRLASSVQSIRASGFHLGLKWARYMDVSRLSIGSDRCRSGEENRYIWSLYAGLLEAERGCFHPDTDYLIHALGAERRARYLETFTRLRPQVVQTMRRAVFGYEDWLRQTSWDFYEELFRRYRPHAVTGHSIYWVPAGSATDGLRLGSPTRVSSTETFADSLEISVPSGVQLVVFDVEYEVRNPLGWAPVLGQTPRFLVELSGSVSDVPVSLSPYSRRSSFPVFVRGESKAVGLHFVTKSFVPGAQWEPVSISYRFGRFPSQPLWQTAIEL